MKIENINQILKKWKTIIKMIMKWKQKSMKTEI